jgi:hypothetical protein
MSEFFKDDQKPDQKPDRQFEVFENFMRIFFQIARETILLLINNIHEKICSMRAYVTFRN